jgi:hypothetical protein
MAFSETINRLEIPAARARAQLPFAFRLQTWTISLRAPSLQAIGVALLAVLIVAQAARGFTDPDFWWHYKAGQYIAAHHSILRSDVFGVSSGQSWIAHEWLAEVLLFGLVQAGGYGSALLVFTISPILTIVLLYWLQRREAISATLALGVTALATLMIAPFSTVRPQVLSWLCFVLLVAALFEYRARRINALWALPLLFALWANLHLSFAIGLAILALFVALHTASRLLSSRPIDRPLALTLFACFVASCLNPYGPRLLFVPFRYLPIQSAFTAPMRLAEWQTPDFHNRLFLPLLAALLLLLATGLYSRLTDLWPASLVIATAALALLSVRYIPYFAIGFAATVGTSIVQRWPRAAEGHACSAIRGGGAYRWLLAGSAAACLVLALRPGSASAFQHGPDADPRFLPVGSMNFIEQNFPNARLFNQYEWGGYILYHLWPANRPFIDGREEMYPLPYLKDYVRIYSVRSGWQETLQRYGIDLVVVRSDSSLAGALQSSAGWRLAYQDGVSVVYARVNNGTQA